MPTTKSYFAPLVVLPTVIVTPGSYVTRDGGVVTVETVSKRHDYGCSGRYTNGTREGWHRSGRLFAGRESANDIIRAV